MLHIKVRNFYIQYIYIIHILYHYIYTNVCIYMYINMDIYIYIYISYIMKYSYSDIHIIIHML